MQLACELPDGGEVICADSMQVWRGMDIGTAKPNAHDRAAIVHHALDLADPHHDAFTAADWLRIASTAIENIRARGRWPIVVGGTNLYLRLLMEGILTQAASNPALRAAMESQETKALRGELERLDPATAAALHPKDRRRTIRALEITHLTGTPASASRTQWSDAAPRMPSHMRLIGIDWPVPAINTRINARVQQMLDAGWQHEVHALLNIGALREQPMEAVGYRELAQAAEGRISLAVATEQIKVRSRRYAKQQRTWLKKFHVAENSFWIDADHNPVKAWSKQVKVWLKSGSRTAYSPTPT